MCLRATFLRHRSAGSWWPVAPVRPLALQLGWPLRHEDLCLARCQLAMFFFGAALWGSVLSWTESRHCPDRAGTCSNGGPVHFHPQPSQSRVLARGKERGRVSGDGGLHAGFYWCQKLGWSQPCDTGQNMYGYCPRPFCLSFIITSFHDVLQTTSLDWGALSLVQGITCWCFHRLTDFKT